MLSSTAAAAAAAAAAAVVATVFNSCAAHSKKGKGTVRRTAGAGKSGQPTSTC